MGLEAAMKAQDSISKTLEGLLPMIQQAQQVVQKAQPQPTIDPAIQKTFEAAMAEINRKTEVDKAENARKDVQIKFEQDQKIKETQLQPLLENMQREFDAKLEVERMQREDERNKFNQWVELQKNEQDNKQHQMTELIKNFQDNQTSLQNKLMEVQNQVKETSEKAGSYVQPNAPDFSPMMKEMSSILAQIEKAKTNDALQATIEGMQALMGSLNAPTELVFGQDGKPVGSRKVLPQ